MAESWNRKQAEVTERWCSVRDKLEALGLNVPSSHAGHMRLSEWEKLVALAESGAALAVRREPELDTGHAPWHEGTHAWAEHNGYPRHQHSVDGALIIHQRRLGGRS